MAVYRKLIWTEHSKIKMKQYGLSKTKLINLIYKPERREQGIVPGTTAVMKTNKILFKPACRQAGKSQITFKNAWQKPKKSPGEVWLMFRDTKSAREGQIRKIISAWRYPGVSKPGEEIPIPDDIKRELLNEEN